MDAAVEPAGRTVRSRLPLLPALAMTALSVGLLVAWAAVNLTMPASVPAGDSSHGNLLFALPEVVGTAMALLLTVRRPGNPVGWLLGGTMIVLTLLQFGTVKPRVSAVIGPNSRPCYRRCVRSRAAIAVTLTAVLGFLSGCGSAAAKPPGTPTSHAFGGTPTVGALFRAGSKEHHCTASVVDSATRNLLITAGHCIAGTAHGYQFAPGYHGGVRPLGSWTVIAAYGSHQWIASKAPQSDFAFLVVGAREVNGRQQEIQDVTGANRLGSAPAPGDKVTVPGYPNGQNDPVTCSAPVYHEGVYPAFNCDAYADGTSGGPWLVQDSQGSVVVGVIGGLHHGGCSWAVYSPVFGPATMSAASSASTGAQGSTFPDASSSDC